MRTIEEMEDLKAKLEQELLVVRSKLCGIYETIPVAVIVEAMKEMAQKDLFKDDSIMQQVYLYLREYKGTVQ